MRRTSAAVHAAAKGETVKSEALIDLLTAEVKRLRKLKGEDVGAFFFVMPPEAEAPISEAFIGSGTGRGAFYKYLADKIDQHQREAAAKDPYIGVAGMGGRR